MTGGKMADLKIRKMTPEDRKQVMAIMRRSFPAFMQLFLSLSENTLIAESGGRIFGGIVLKVFDLPKGSGKGGVVEWIFTSPEARGLGAGQALIEAGLAWLEDSGCSQVFAIVEGYNTSSSKLFATRGFSILPFREQVRRFGLFGLFRVWFASFHITDVGHFLWGKPSTALADTPAPQFLGTLIINALTAALVVWRSWQFGRPDLAAMGAFPLAVLVLIELRTIAMVFAGRRQRLDLRFRAWESGFNLSIPLALLFGFFFPVPGSLYPKQPLWRYRDQRKEYGLIGLAGILPALAIAWALFFLLRITSLPASVNSLLSLAFTGAFFFAIFDVLPIFFPFVSFNGRRIWDWNKAVWAICAAAMLALFILGWVM
jgi:GNAT superfamily N-acetyltransferase